MLNEPTSTEREFYIMATWFHNQKLRVLHVVDKNIRIYLRNLFHGKNLNPGNDMKSIEAKFGDDSLLKCSLGCVC